MNLSYVFPIARLWSIGNSVWRKIGLSLFLTACWTCSVFGQYQITGTVTDADDGKALVGVRILIVGTTTGGLTDGSGAFSINSPKAAPVSLELQYLSYDSLIYEVSSFAKPLNISMKPAPVTIAQVDITATALSETQQRSALTVESMSINAIKETPAANFYEGLGHLKGVDMNAASFGFKVVNTRGFNSTQPVRSLQLIDGVDNQSPGFNFSLGNFLGASELDLESVDLVVGASSAFYGPNAFNGVIAMQTKNPFVHRGLSASIKIGERNWVESAVRYAKVFTNKKGEDKLAIKLNLFYLRADDWEADNFEESYRDTTEDSAIPYVGINNPGGYDAVNRYGDEVFGIADELGGDKIQVPGLGKFYRTGYNEEDLLDYDTRNIKAAVALHYKLTDKVELIAGSNYSNGTTVFQGINRISLKDIQFFQHKVEVRKPGTFFVRAYMTYENAGNSYDPVFTALRLQNLQRNDNSWNNAYRRYWGTQITPQIKQFEGYPELMISPEGISFDFDQQADVLQQRQAEIRDWHAETRTLIDEGYLVPGSPEFQAAFDSITSLIITKEGGTKFFDKSALYHLHGEYKFKPSFGEITLGGNGRLYTPNTEGSIFSDTGSVSITNMEFGVYAGLRKKMISDRLTMTGTLRMDKNQNFRYLFSPALTGAFQLNERHTLRMSLSSAIRNPTLADQYLFYNVGGAILVGNINGYDDLITMESLRSYFNTLNLDTLKRFDLGRIEPEQVTTGEIGYRGLINNQLYVDAGYYYSRYQNFIGYRFAFRGEIVSGFPAGKVFRVASNADSVVTTQGAAIGLTYFLPGGYTIGGNYSWNVLNTKTDDPIVPAYNTPEHKFNINLAGRDLNLGKLKHVGFNLNYKWVQGFLFEGSPQFTGLIPTYSLLDAQINKRFPDLNTTVKLGASNILNNQVFTVYGGPRIGRLSYLSLTYDFNR
ncbi:MAG: TonB-dependent receptor [Bacteroidota bacterium]